MSPDDRKADANIELRPAGWDRFDAAVKAAAKSGLKHRPPTASKRTSPRHKKTLKHPSK